MKQQTNSNPQLPGMPTVTSGLVCLHLGLLEHCRPLEALDSKQNRVRMATYGEIYEMKDVSTPAVPHLPVCRREVVGLSLAQGGYRGMPKLGAIWHSSMASCWSCASPQPCSLEVPSKPGTLPACISARNSRRAILGRSTLGRSAWFWMPTRPRNGCAYVLSSFFKPKACLIQASLLLGLVRRMEIRALPVEFASVGGRWPQVTRRNAPGGRRPQGIAWSERVLTWRVALCDACSVLMALARASAALSSSVAKSAVTDGSHLLDASAKTSAVMRRLPDSQESHVTS